MESKYLSRPHDRMLEQSGRSEYTRRGSLILHPSSSCGLGTADFRNRRLYAPSSSTKPTTQKKMEASSNSSFLARLRRAAPLAILPGWAITPGKTGSIIHHDP